MHVDFCIANFIDTVFVKVYFCRFEFVKQLKRKIDEALSPLIEDEIEKFAMAGQVDTSGQETLVSKITQSVIHSKPYVIRVNLGGKFQKKYNLYRSTQYYCQF